jgi:hypothetical protein
MAETTEQPPPGAPGLTREAEETGFYHEAALNASWTGARLALGGSPGPRWPGAWACACGRRTMPRPPGRHGGCVGR